MRPGPSAPLSMDGRKGDPPRCCLLPPIRSESRSLRCMPPSLPSRIRRGGFRARRGSATCPNGKSTGAKGIVLEINAPSAWKNEAFRIETGRWERACASPGSIVELMRINYDIDVRHVLPVIHVPPLVMHRLGDSLIPSACGRYLAENIEGARFVGMPGTDHSITDADSQDFVADQIEEFITGQRTTREVERVLATVMFTDIVG